MTTWVSPGPDQARGASRGEDVMSNEMMLEQRLAAVEQALADLQRRLASGPAPSSWLDRVTGSITDEETFREILELGRTFRSADRPPDEAVDEP